MLTPTTSVLGSEPLNHENSQYLISFLPLLPLEPCLGLSRYNRREQEMERYAMSFLGITHTLTQPINHPNYHWPHIQKSSTALRCCP